MTEITPALLRELLDYDPASGRLFWKERAERHFKVGKGRYTAARNAAIWNTKYAGQEAFTTIGNHGYPVGGILNKTFLKHRVMWAIEKGEWPPEKLDHRDRNRGNCLIGNLRPSTQAENMLNRVGNQTGKKTSRFKGVYWDKSISRWIARFRDRYIGTFTDEESAARAYDAKSRAFNPDFAFQNFAVGG